MQSCFSLHRKWDKDSSDTSSKPLMPPSSSIFPPWTHAGWRGNVGVLGRSTPHHNCERKNNGLHVSGITLIIYELWSSLLTMSCKYLSVLFCRLWIQERDIYHIYEDFKKVCYYKTSSSLLECASLCQNVYFCGKTLTAAALLLWLQHNRNMKHKVCLLVEMLPKKPKWAGSLLSLRMSYFFMFPLISLQ